MRTVRRGRDESAESADADAAELSAFAEARGFLLFFALADGAAAVMVSASVPTSDARFLPRFAAGASVASVLFEWGAAAAAAAACRAASRALMANGVWWHGQQGQR